MFLLLIFYCFFGVYRCLGRGAVVECSEGGPPAGHRFLLCSVPAAHDTGLCGGTIVFHRHCSFLFLCCQRSATGGVFHLGMQTFRFYHIFTVLLTMFFSKDLYFLIALVFCIILDSDISVSEISVICVQMLS